MNPQPEPVADAGGVVERLEQMMERLDAAHPGLPARDPDASTVDEAVEVIQSLLAQVERLKAERDDLQAEAGTQALTIRRLTQEREKAQMESADLTRALTGLTGGGSEFFVRRGERYVADIDACVGWITARRADAYARALTAIRERKAAESALATEREAKARMVEAAQALADDYQTSPRHHPDHVLVPLAAFEALRAALQATAGQGGEHDAG